MSKVISVRVPENLRIALEVNDSFLKLQDTLHLDIRHCFGWLYSCCALNIIVHSRFVCHCHCNDKRLVIGRSRMASVSRRVSFVRGL